VLYKGYFIVTQQYRGRSELPQTDRQQTSKRDQAIELLKNDPALMDMTMRELEDRTGINKSAWSEAKRAFNAVPQPVE
jgi:DNA-directed RNA polymerase specialized sigma subunit